ncbi:WxL domain-containing protein [Peribacillus frigoritolerans]|uniref:WxL domain-containing protein n=1 Tax=Peribacillus frigoritolerans TaxID=450367 RepID=UPI00399F7C8A
MKAFSLSAVGSIILAGTLLSTSSAEAAVINDATSNNYIGFIADEGPTNPVDPTNPDNPNPPSPIDPEDPGNGGTGNAGALTLDNVSNIQFGTQKIMSGNTTYHAKNKDPFVQVSDKRGTGEGWSLTAKASEFKSDSGEVLRGAILSFKNGQVKSQTSNVSTPPTANDVVFDNSDSKVPMLAEVDAGRGTWLDVFSGTEGDNSNVQLNVLAGSADAQNYTATMTWELSDAPK